MSYIPYGRQDINNEDIKAVVDVLNSDFLTQGPRVPAFEKSVQNYTQAKFSFAMNSATSALHVACMALDIGPSDIVWTTAITFVASSNCALYLGATVDFIDIDENTYNLWPEALEKKLIIAKKNNKLPKLVIPVHLTGQSCDMEKIYSLSKEYGFKIVEDASHAIGGKYQNKPVGSCQYSDITIFSFHPVKIVTSAEGGMALTNDKKIAEKIELFRSHGITKNQDLMKNESHGPWYYEQVELGYNYRMTELQAALGETQMKRIDGFISRRHEIASFYNESLSNLPLVLPFQNDQNYSAYHLYVIRLKLDQINKTHREVFEELREKGLGVNLHYIPVYKQPYYQNLGFDYNYCPNAEKYYTEAISIPMYSSINQEQLDKVVNVLNSVLG